MLEEPKIENLEKLYFLIQYIIYFGQWEPRIPRKVNEFCGKDGVAP